MGGVGGGGQLQQSSRQWVEIRGDPDPPPPIWIGLGEIGMIVCYLMAGFWNLRGSGGRWGGGGVVVVVMI